MKKLFLALVLAVVGCVSGFAQAGTSAAGINLGIGIGLDEPKPKNFDLGIKYQYNITDPIRLEAVFNYGLKDKEVKVLTYGVNAHYIVNPESSLKFYPVVGLGAATIKVFDFSETRFMFNVGAGAEYAITENIAAALEIKYQYIKDFGRLPITLGITYKF